MSESDKITEHTNKYRDWRGDLLKDLRLLINESAPAIKELVQAAVSYNKR